jgi:L,D-transpeptidase ErfK/SrfK
MVSAHILLFLLLSQIVGQEFTYTVAPGDSLTSIGARFGVDVSVTAEANQLPPSALLKVGQSLRIDNRHIAPETDGNSIIVNIPQRMLFYRGKDGVLHYYPLAAGSRGWRTPIGEFTIVNKETDPTWDVPLSIQEEMRRQGKAVQTRVPPSPGNPLGKYWIGLTLPGIGIHGTNSPLSIYSHRTHGCMRLHPDDIEALFPLVEIGETGRTVYEPILMTQVNGAVFLEAHPDVYRKAPPPLDRARELADALGISEMVDWPLAEKLIGKQEGIARDVTHRTGGITVTPYLSNGR